MKQKIRNIFYYFLLPVFLFLLGSYSLFSYLGAGEFGITNLDIHQLEWAKLPQKSELLKGNTLLGKFHSRFSNLGIVSLRFDSQGRGSDDILVFRLREAGTAKWRYEANYKTDQIQPHQLFPFGFPVIRDSAGKDFEFQLESLRGATGSGIFLDSQSPIFIAKSSFTKSELLTDKSLLVYFLKNKFLNISEDPDTLLNALLFFLPLFLFLIFIATKKVRSLSLILLAMVPVVSDIFGLTGKYDFIYLSVAFFWALLVRRYRLDSRVSGYLAIGFLGVTTVLIVLKQMLFADKAAVWAFLFLCLTVIQQIYEQQIRQKQSRTKSTLNIHTNRSTNYEK